MYFNPNLRASLFKRQEHDHRVVFPFYIRRGPPWAENDTSDNRTLGAVPPTLPAQLARAASGAFLRPWAPQRAQHPPQAHSPGLLSLMLC